MRENGLRSQSLDGPKAHHSALLHVPDNVIPGIQVANSASILPAEAASRARSLAALTRIAL